MKLITSSADIKLNVYYLVTFPDASKVGLSKFINKNEKSLYEFHHWSPTNSSYDGRCTEFDLKSWIDGNLVYEIPDPKAEVLISAWK